MWLNPWKRYKISKVFLVISSMHILKKPVINLRNQLGYDNRPYPVSFMILALTKDYTYMVTNDGIPTLESS